MLQRKLIILSAIILYVECLFLLGVLKRFHIHGSQIHSSTHKQVCAAAADGRGQLVWQFRLPAISLCLKRMSETQQSPSAAISGRAVRVGYKSAPKLVRRVIYNKMDVRMISLDPRAIKDLLRMYRESPCLWDQTDLHYMNKEARKDAFNLIFKKMKTYHEDITLEIVKRKLENMRATYKREVRKMMAARQRGEDGYRTTLWYFDLMAFIDGGTVPDAGTSREDNEEEENDENEEEEENDQESHADTEFPYITAEYLDEEPVKRKKSRNSNSILSKKIKQELDTQPNISGVFLTNPDQEEPVLSLNNENSEALAFGKALGYQLKEIEGIQRVIAEKLISDVIFNARLNKLTTSSTIQLNSELSNLLLQ